VFVFENAAKLFGNYDLCKPVTPGYLVEGLVGSVQTLAGHVEGECLVGKGLAHAQVGGHVDQVTGTRLEVQYGLRFDVVGTEGYGILLFKTSFLMVMIYPPLLPFPTSHPLKVPVLHHPLGHKVHAVVGGVHHAAIALRQIEHYDAVAAIRKYSI